MFENLPLQPTPLQKATAELDAFINNPGLTELAGLFDAPELPTDSDARLSALYDLATEYWDFRRGAERQAINWGKALDDRQASAEWNAGIFEASTKLKLVQNTKPQNKEPNSLVFLGGAGRTPVNHVKYGLGAVDNFDQIAYLGSSRKVSDKERKSAKDYAPDAQVEFDLGCGAFETLLGAVAIDEVRIPRGGDDWRMRIYQFKRGGVQKHGYVLSTPREKGGRRANTYDNYRFFADSADLSHDPDHTVVAVTMGYVSLGQHLPAVQELTLKHGATIETVGYSADYDAFKPEGNGGFRWPSELLQETKAAIDAAKKLRDAIELERAT